VLRDVLARVGLVGGVNARGDPSGEDGPVVNRKELRMRPEDGVSMIYLYLYRIPSRFKVGARGGAAATGNE